jgi:hypothetical protein
MGGERPNTYCKLLLDSCFLKGMWMFIGTYALVTCINISIPGEAWPSEQQLSAEKGWKRWIPPQ